MAAAYGPLRRLYREICFLLIWLVGRIQFLETTELGPHFLACWELRAISNSYTASVFGSWRSLSLLLLSEDSSRVTSPLTAAREGSLLARTLAVRWGPLNHKAGISSSLTQSYAQLSFCLVRQCIHSSMHQGVGVLAGWRHPLGTPASYSSLLPPNNSSFSCLKLSSFARKREWMT